MAWHSAVGLYLLLSGLWIGLAQAAKISGLGETTAWLLESIALPLALLVLVYLLAPRVAAKPAAELLQLGKPTRLSMVVAVVAG